MHSEKLPTCKRMAQSVKRRSRQIILVPIADNEERRHKVSARCRFSSLGAVYPLTVEVPERVEQLVFSWPFSGQLPDLAPLAALRVLTISNVLGNLVLPDFSLNGALEEIELSGLDLLDVPETVATATGLTTLRIEGCWAMTCINKFVKRAAVAGTLRALEVRETPLLLERVLDIKSLRRLVVANIWNKEQVLPQMTQDVGLVHLSIRDVQCPQEMRMQKLECVNDSLEIFSIECGSVPSLAGFRNLSSLYLHDTEIELLDEGIGMLTQLRILDLRNNPYLATLPRALGKLTGLKKLSVVGARERSAVSFEESEVPMCVAFFLHVGAFPALRELVLGRVGPVEARALSDVIRNRFAAIDAPALPEPYADLRCLEIAGSFPETFAAGTGVILQQDTWSNLAGATAWSGLEAKMARRWTRAVLGRMRALRRRMRALRGCVAAGKLMDNDDAHMRLREHVFGVVDFARHYSLGSDEYPFRFSEEIAREHAQRVLEDAQGNSYGKKFLD